MLEFVSFVRSSFLFKGVAALISVLLTLNLSVNSMVNNNESLDPGDYDNVILMIGDGMGYNHLYWMEQEYGVDANIFEMADFVGSSKTQSSSAYLTDSAAGGTALACATRTTNGAIGVFPQDQYAAYYYAQNLCELAQSYGKMTGVVTSDENSGATPASFSAHVFDRDEDQEITRQQIEESKHDLIWAADNGLVTDEWADEYGWTLVNNTAEFEALEEGERSFGAFPGNLWNTDTGADSPNLSTLTAKAIDMLDDDDDGEYEWFDDEDEEWESSIDSMLLSPATIDALHAAGIYAIDELKKMSDTELLHIKGIGKKRVEEIKEALEYED